MPYLLSGLSSSSILARTLAWRYGSLRRGTLLWIGDSFFLFSFYFSFNRSYINRNSDNLLRIDESVSLSEYLILLGISGNLHPLVYKNHLSFIFSSTSSQYSLMLLSLISSSRDSSITNQNHLIILDEILLYKQLHMIKL